jgi:DNA-binding XRE family transcriptional regulator
MPKLPHLRKLRESKFLTQKELAEQAGVHEITVVRLEAEDNAQLSTAKKLAKALGVKPEELVG